MTDSTERWFSVSLSYRTKAGNIGSWRGDVFGTWETVDAKARERVLKLRGRYIQGFWGGSIEPYSDGYIPSGAVS